MVLKIKALMSPKKKSAAKKAAHKTPPPPKKVTLADALKCISELPNPETTQKIWRASIISLSYHLAREDNADNSLTYEELAEKYADVNIKPFIEDFDKVLTLIESDTIKNKHNGEPVGLEFKKQVWYAILAIVGQNGVIDLPKETLEKYKEKKVEYDLKSTQGRKINAPKRAVLEHPDLTYPVFTRGYEDFIATKSFTKDGKPLKRFTDTAKGNKDLRIATLIGFYIIQRPRRVEDICSLMLYSKLPSEKEMEGKNILLVERIKEDSKYKNQYTIHIDDFKTRYRTVKGKRKEVLPRFEKVLNSRLASLLDDYITRWEVVDNIKSKGKEHHYVFYKETGKTTEPYDSNGFSKYITSCLKQIYKKSGLSVNTIRHTYADWIWNNPAEYNTLQLEQIAIEVGDKSIFTHMGYRQANQANRDKAITQIDDDRKVMEQAVNMVLEGGLIEGQDEDDEVKSDAGNSPPPRVVDNPIHINTDEPLLELYAKLGRLTMEVETVKASIARKLVG